MTRVLNLICVSLLSLVVGSVLISVTASAQSFRATDINPQVSPGAVHQGYMNQQFLNQNMGWMNRPITAADFAPPTPNEPVIEFLNVEVEGVVLPSRSHSPEEVQIRDEIHIGR